jgi:hypothetical protein
MGHLLTQKERRLKTKSCGIMSVLRKECKPGCQFMLKTPYDSAISLKDIYPKELKSDYRRDTHTYCSSIRNSLRYEIG